MRRIATMMVGLALLGGCKAADDSRTREEAVASSGFTPPVTQAPRPVAGQANATPLVAYVGHDPRDAVEGVSFYDRTEVANALVDIVPEADLRHELTGREVTNVPIFRVGSRIAAHGCAPHDCADRHWTVYVSTDGNSEKATACYHDAATMGAASRWSTRAGATTRPGICPQA